VKSGARLAAAVTILTEITARHRPAALALSDWGKASRFAGSGDRSAVGNLVYDALRRRGSIAARMGAGTPRALVLGAASRALGLDLAAIAAAADGSRHALEPLTDAELAALERDEPMRDGELLADVPAWIVPQLRQALGDRLPAEAAALSERAPVDIRANTLKTTRAKLLAELDPLGPTATTYSPIGIPDARRMSKLNPRTARACSKCRTKARRSRRCSWTHDPATTCSISAPAPVARHSRSPPP